MRLRPAPPNFPPCPACHDGTGCPATVELGQGEITIILTCWECGHIWRQVREASPLDVTNEYTQTSKAS